MREIDPTRTPEWLALCREAGIAAELLGAGLTSLRHADAAIHGLYNLAFFNLSIGLERVGKLIIVLDHICRNHRFPTDDVLKERGHDVAKLIIFAQEIKQQYSWAGPKLNLDDETIEFCIIQTLTNFAKASRYYNLNLLVGDTKSRALDPLLEWDKKVATKILKKHYPREKSLTEARMAEALGRAVGQFMDVHHTAEDGTPIESISDMLKHGHRTTIVQKFALCT